MKTVIYEPLEHSDASWYCCIYGLPNLSTSLFEDFEIHTYSLSSNLNETSTSINDSIQSTTNIGPPQCTSSPTTKQNKCPVNKKSLRLLNINFQSMKAKREEFWSMLEYTDPDIIIASETWLKPEIKESEVLPDSYHFVARKDRPGSAHGGTAIIARSNIDAVEVDTNTNTEFVAAAFSCKNLKKTLIIGSLYRPTNNNSEYTDDLCKAISNLYSSFKDHIIWIGGDANLPDIDWQNDSIQGHNSASRNKQSIYRFNQRYWMPADGRLPN